MPDHELPASPCALSSSAFVGLPAGFAADVAMPSGIGARVCAVRWSEPHWQRGARFRAVLVVATTVDDVAWRVGSDGWLVLEHGLGLVDVVRATRAGT